MPGGLLIQYFDTDVLCLPLLEPQVSFNGLDAEKFLFHFSFVLCLRREGSRLDNAVECEAGDIS